MKTAVPELKENSQRHTNLQEKGRWELKTAVPEFKENSQRHTNLWKRERGSETCYF